jgi:glycosyltransferase involved in cell wall biosynthesis
MVAKGTACEEMIPFEGGHPTVGASEVSVPGPVVSVVVPNLNKGEYVGWAIESLLAQTLTDIEVIVVDNGSKDRSLQVIEDYTRRDTRVTLVKEPRLGISHALNAGMSRARGEFLAVLGSDDVCHPQRLRKQVQILREGGASVCYTESWMLDEDGKETGRLWNRDKVRLPSNHEGYIFHELLRSDFTLGGTVMTTREAAKKVQYNESLSYGEDWDFCVRLARSVKFAYLPDPLYGYRVYSRNTWAKGNETKVLSNHIRLFQGWLDDFPELTREERTYLMKRLLHCVVLLKGRGTALKVALAHPRDSLGVLKKSKAEARAD